MAAQQQLGHKLLGGVGVNAGVQSEPGLYILDRFLRYGAHEIKDRNGDPVPVPGLDIDAVGNLVGLSVTIKPERSPYFSMAAGVPIARVTVNSDLPQASIDRSGIGDAFVQPLKIGFKDRHFDVVALYTFYAPTGKFEPRGSGVGRGYWTHQLSLGGALFPALDRRWRASVLASYDMNGWKRGIDIKRGNSAQIQGGAGLTVFQVVMVGVAGFALWQVTDDQGADIPVALRDLRTRVFGLGPELAVALPPLNLYAELRYEHEFGTRSRPEGNVLVAGLSYRAWRPRGKDSTN
ncbi:MAG: SphA family protein [Longimicrobiales bacterium]